MIDRAAILQQSRLDLLEHMGEVVWIGTDEVRMIYSPYQEAGVGALRAPRKAPAYLALPGEVARLEITPGTRIERAPQEEHALPIEHTVAELIPRGDGFVHLVCRLK